MRIHIQTEGARFFVPLPTGLLCSRAGARLVLYILRQSGHTAPIPPQTVYAAQKALRQYLRRYGHFTLVDVESADGDRVKIVL